MKAVILAGGSGSRLWPLSRNSKPKQFQNLIGRHTMLQDTVARLNFLKKSDIYIATNESYLDFVREQCPEIPSKQIIIEPAMRDTATCIGYAAMLIEHYHPGEVMAVIYSDHLIQDHDEFAKKLKTAEKIARREHTINIIEVKAKLPNTNLGYVKIGKMLYEMDGSEIFELDCFVEKPDLKTAREFLKSFKFLWNTGYYVWETRTILTQYEKYHKKTFARLMEIKKTLGTEQEKEIIEKNYSACEKISIDYAIMEKVPASLVRIIPADFGWSDVGTWGSLYDEVAKKERENIISGSVIELESESCLIQNHDKKLIATLGLKDLVIINTADALLICPKERSSELKNLLKKIPHKNL